MGYFEQLLKDRKLKEMRIDEDRSVWDAAITTVRLTPEGIERETASIVPSVSTETVLNITLERGQIKLRRYMREIPPKGRF